MANKTTATATASFPLFGILGVAFVILKLCHVIGWSWWWVTAPFWAPVVFWLGVLVLVGVVLLVSAVIDR